MNRFELALAGAVLFASAAAASCSAVGVQATGQGGASAGAGAGLSVGAGAGGAGATSSTGVLTSSGPGAGTGGGPPPPTECDASCETAGGTCLGGVCHLSDNPGNVDSGTQAALTAGGNADGSFGWLYPYDGTVFPRGLITPTFQYSGAAVDAFYVHITFAGMDYEGFYAGSAKPRIKLSDPVWTAVTYAARSVDTVHVEVTKIAGGAVTGPIAEDWRIAEGSIRGTIYYETYDSPLIGGIGAVGLMKIAPGAAQPTVLKTGCGNVCHTASADGSTLVANSGSDFSPNPANSYINSSTSYDLKNNAAVIKKQNNLSFTYGGIYPDGSFVVSATNYRTWAPPFGKPSHLYDTATGAQIPTPSWDNTVTKSGTPAFSPDGTFIAFNHLDTASAGHTLAVMAYDKASNTFSGLVDVAHDPNSVLAWPAFTPDSQRLVYHGGSNAQYETDGGSTGDLFIADIASKTSVALDRLNGWEGGNVYLPANDPHLNFAPTVLPEAVGGYFWVVFTSHRSYGNTLVSQDNNDQNGKLWVAALDFPPTGEITALTDPSHPAFYLDGQESAADNLRGFWVLDPCQQNGASCTGGDQCCGGFCHEDNGVGTCDSSPNGGCSADLDKCTQASDCCNAKDHCINGRCAVPAPQ